VTSERRDEGKVSECLSVWVNRKKKKEIQGILTQDKRGVNMFSPYAVKAGTAQGEEEGEGIYDAYPYSNLYG
jgi:hypothetical protein